MLVPNLPGTRQCKEKYIFSFALHSFFHNFG